MEVICTQLWVKFYAPGFIYKISCMHPTLDHFYRHVKSCGHVLSNFPFVYFDAIYVHIFLFCVFILYINIWVGRDILTRYIMTNMRNMMQLKTYLIL